jgi:carbon-monoxide dehydrogenase large subunit
MSASMGLPLPRSLPQPEWLHPNGQRATELPAEGGQMASDLELEIQADPEPGSYSITVRSPAGEATGSSRLDVTELSSRRRELQATVLASAVTKARRILSPAEETVREVGQALFRALFTGPIYGRYTASVATATAQGEPLRVVLRLRAPELAALPWEAMFDPEADEYLCQREPLVRYVEAASPAIPLTVRPPLRILGLVAAPNDLAALDVADERRRLERALAVPMSRKQVQLVWATGGTWADLQDMLLSESWHVVHFIGHGGYDSQQQEGILALVGPDGLADLVTADRFTRLLHTARPMPRLVVLNSCSSGEAGAQDLFSSTGAALVRSGVSGVVAMQYAVSDPAAIAFAHGFYAAIAQNRSVGEAVRIGRIAIDGTGPHTLEWVTPVLYLRGSDRPLFTVTESADTVVVAATEQAANQPPEQAARDASLYGLYVQARAEFRLQRYDTAATLFDSLLALDPHYRDAAEQREAARRMLRLATTYEQARAAEDAGDMAAALRRFAAIVDVDPQYRDAASRLASCQERQEIIDLDAELRFHAGEGNWQAVLAVSEDLAHLDPTAADPDGLASAARAKLQADEVPAPTWRRPQQEVAQGAEVSPLAPPARPLRRPSEQMGELGRVVRDPGARLGRSSALVAGQGSYVDNLTAPGMVWISVLRSPIAHGRIDRVDTTMAMDMPGVIAAFTGADLANDWAASLPCAWPATKNTKMPTHWPVTQDKARFQGDAVAVVVADTREHAVDGVESVEVDYEDLPTLMDLDEALRERAALVHDDIGTNVCFDDYKLEKGNVDRVFAEAPVVVKETYWHPRLIPTAIEPRGVLVQPKSVVGEFTVWSSTQIPHLLRTTLALTLGVSESQLQVIAPDVGGGFGSKLDVYPEEAICLAIARRLGRPVKWVEERSENYLATHHGRGVRQDIEVAATKEGKLLAVRVNVLADMGAYTQFFTPVLPTFGAPLYAGPYSADAFSVQIAGVFTNRTPTGPYRGAGRAEATFAIERVMDTLARRVGKDPAEIRRVNFIPPFDRSTTAPSGARYDSANYEVAFEKALKLADYYGIRREQTERRQRSDMKQLGIGLSAYVTQSVSASSKELAAAGYRAGGWEVATIRCEPTGKVVIVTGTSPHGQDHETSWAQIAANALGVKAEDIEVLHGDTAISPQGLDTYGSRSVATGGVAIELAAGKIVNKAKKIFAYKQKVAEDDIEWTQGKLQVRGAPRTAKTIPDIAISASNPHNLPKGVEPGLEETYKYDPPNSTYPSGTHVCVVEVDIETGLVEVVKYVTVEDAGNLVTPIIADGMVQGGAAQGIAEAMFEEAIYDDYGDLLVANISSYRVPSAAEVPTLVTNNVMTPSSSNPSGWKGIGEVATVGAPPAVVNAVIDALQPVGVTYVDKPVSPENVWRAIQSARNGDRV